MIAACDDNSFSTEIRAGVKHRAMPGLFSRYSMPISLGLAFTRGRQRTDRACFLTDVLIRRERVSGAAGVVQDHTFPCPELRNGARISGKLGKASRARPPQREPRRLPRRVVASALDPRLVAGGKGMSIPRSATRHASIAIRIRLSISLSRNDLTGGALCEAP